MRRNGRTGGVPVRNQFGALLKGLLRCGPCDAAMTPTHTRKGGNGDRRYRYYVCCRSQKRGRSTCPSRSVPAGSIEEFVVDRIRCVGRDPELRRSVLKRGEPVDPEKLRDAYALYIKTLHRFRQLQDRAKQIYVDPDGKVTGYDDVFTRIAKCRAHYEAIGLGGNYIEQFIR